MISQLVQHCQLWGRIPKWEGALPLGYVFPSDAVYLRSGTGVAAGVFPTSSWCTELDTDRSDSLEFFWCHGARPKTRRDLGSGDVGDGGTGEELNSTPPSRCAKYVAAPSSIVVVREAQLCVPLME